MSTTTQRPRSTLDVFYYICNAIGGEGARERCKREFLSIFPPNPAAIRDISEDEYKWMIHQVRKELPYFLNWLMGQDFSHIKLAEFGGN